MKLLLENWNKFLKEQEVNEAIQKEIDYLDEALQIPVSELPFSNIFGNSYRIIEPVNSVKQETPLAKVIFALNKFGWEVDPASDLEYHDETKGPLAGKVKGGKILCRKTKITHYIDGKGKQGVSRKTMTLNLPKLMGAIIKFIEETRPKLLKEVGAIAMQGAQRYTDTSKELPEDAKYIVPAGVFDSIPYTANEYRKIMSFYDAQMYWINSKRSSGKTKLYFNAIGVDYENFKEFSKYAIERFDDLVRNMDQYLERNYIIYSRHPVDVFRMSDHRKITSCHALPSRKGQKDLDQYNKCALSEVYGNGMIAYVVPVKNFKMFPPTQESLDKFGNQEIFLDEMRRDETSDLIEPTSRIRIKNVAFHKDERSEPVRLAVSQGKIYGPRVPGFLNAVNKKLAKTQEKEVKEIIKQGTEASGKQEIDLSKFTRYGGSYQDTGHEVAKTLPMLFRKFDRDLVLRGDEVSYNQDIEDSIVMRIGRRTLTPDELMYRVEQILEPYNDYHPHLDFRARPRQLYEGGHSYAWTLSVSFSFETPGGAQRGKVKKIVEDLADYDFPAHFGLPVPDNYFFMGRDVSENWGVEIIYAGRDLGTDRGDFQVLRRQLPEIVNRMSVFKQDHEDGVIKMILDELKSSGVINSQRYLIKNLLEKYNLPEESWWPEVERHGDRSFSGAISSISFEEKGKIFISDILQSVPPEQKEEALTYMAVVLNGIAKNDDLSTSLALNKNTAGLENEPTILIHFDNLLEDLKPEDLADVDQLEFTASVGMYNDYSKEVLEKTAKFLQNYANINGISDRIEDRLINYIDGRLSGKRNITENKKRLRIRVRR
jgi:hypothetical protein